MSLNGDIIREDGHTMLLIETKNEEKTFKSYDTQEECLIALIAMFEATSEKHDIKDFFKWIDDFRKLELFTLDRSITRYRSRSGAALKELYEQSGDDGQYQPVQNGHGLESDGSMRSCSLDIDDHREHDMELSDDNDDWEE